VRRFTGRGSTRFSNRTPDGSSLRGGSSSGRADGTVVHQSALPVKKAQMIDNAFVQQVKTIAITADELWSFINKTLSAWGNWEVIAGLAPVRPRQWISFGSAGRKARDELSIGVITSTEGRTDCQHWDTDGWVWKYALSPEVPWWQRPHSTTRAD